MAMLQKTDQKRQLTNANAETAPIQSVPEDLTLEVLSLISHSSYSISLDDGDVLFATTGDGNPVGEGFEDQNPIYNSKLFKEMVEAQGD